MKNRIYLLITFVFLNPLISVCFAQGWQKMPVLISGKVTGPIDYIKDSITVVIAESYLLFGDTTFTIPISDNGTFNIRIHPIDIPASISIFIKEQPNLFIMTNVEPGDSVYWDIDFYKKEPSIKYFGSNVIKYACVDSLNAEWNLFSKQREIAAKKIHASENTEKKYSDMQGMFSRGYLRILDILENYKEEVNPNMLSYISGTYKYLYFNTWGLEVKSAMQKSKSIDEKRILKRIYQFDQFPGNDIDQSTLSSNENYLRYLIEKCKTDLIVDSLGKGFSYYFIYGKLKERFSGITRERLLTYFLFDPGSSRGVINYSNRDYENCLNDAYSQVSDQYLKNKIFEKFNLVKGTKAFNFSMPDTTGKLVSLADLKGKVILLDVWAEGCTACAVFSNMFKQSVYPKLKDNSNFLFVSIGVNKTREGWIRGINSGLYTKKYHLNLFTEGKMLEHPFAKYYNILAIPFILLIDKEGNIYTKIDFTLGQNELFELINNALNVSKLN